ncbi:MAG TPA: NADP-dependent isocitrate dehydrogenase [Candidatus Aquilonibacter sp.]|nr:NADP-dependent isocitrate dehydrogenase [Candidatus Aquilonibacter sp.]
MAIESPLSPSTRVRVPIAVAAGDGIGPEITSAVMTVLREAGAALDYRTVELGERVYRRGVPSGIEDETLELLSQTGVLLKAPITTPQGGGFKSLNVTIRKMFGLYANVRPCRPLSPFVATLHPDMDVVIVRENEEDVYGAIEHRQTQDVTQCLKLITRSGSERIIRYAFEYARANRRKRVTCFSKDNIMKITDGLFHQVFREIAAQYDDIESDHMIIDIGTAKLATQPERFDVIVLPNLYGDILSDVAAELCGSIGLAGSSNIGDGFAMFEAVHGSAPDIAGTGTANPSGLLNAAVMMLVHVGQTDVAQAIQDAWLTTIEDGLHTRDIFGAHSKRCVSTSEFAQAIVERLGMRPRTLQSPAVGTEVSVPASAHHEAPRAQKSRIGVDVFLDWNGEARELGNRLAALATPLQLEMITNRGTQVWPRSSELTRCVDHWRCRFLGNGTITSREMLATMNAVDEAGFDIIKTEGLFEFDGKAGFSRGQGQ